MRDFLSSNRLSEDMVRLDTKTTFSFVIIFTIFFISPVFLNAILFSPSRTEDENASYVGEINSSLISDKIFINGTSDWVDFKNAGNCTGQGTYFDPYVIKNLIINGQYGGNCIWIENSEIYFKIENCTVYNGGTYGVYLFNVSNGNLINNTIYLNYGVGISLESSQNNTVLDSNLHHNYDGIRIFESNNNYISGNHVSDNILNGIYISNSNDTVIMGNTLENNNIGIDLWRSNYSLISGNMMNDCGLRISGNVDIISSNKIDKTNLVNGKNLYFYANEIDLRPSNFTNAGQVILLNCSDSLISNLDVSRSSLGISLYHCNNNNISSNIANDNLYGISLDVSDLNQVIGNIASYNYWNGIDLEESNNNTISGNTVDHNSVGIGLWNSNKSLISANSGNSNSFYGVWLEESNNNTLSSNTLNNNGIGILLDKSNDNTVRNNNLLENDQCITEENSARNILENNNCGETPAINGYNILSLITLICFVSLILFLKTQRSRK